MKYLNQVITVTRWEYRRFFKPKNELMGLSIMLLVSIISYFGGKYALSGSNEKPDLAVFMDLDRKLTDRLLIDFKLHAVSADQKSYII